MRTLHALVLALRAHIQILGIRLIRSAREAAPGQGLVEYGLILVLIAVTCVGILTLVGQQVSGAWYQRIYNSLDAILN